MPDFIRYAVYYAPQADSDLAQFGAEWLGWDAQTGKAVPHIACGFPLSEITATPRKYGFHGTLKPPFHLANGTDFEGLNETLAALAGELPAFELPRFQVTPLGSFIALTLVEPNDALAQLATAAVMALDTFRAPPSAAELDRRRASLLTARQEELLQEWGYPYVMDQFRFHMTLTGKLAPDQKTQVLETLEGLMAPILGEPSEMSELCLFGQAADGQFHLIKRYPLTGT